MCGNEFRFFRHVKQSSISSGLLFISLCAALRHQAGNEDERCVMNGDRTLTSRKAWVGQQPIGIFTIRCLLLNKCHMTHQYRIASLLFKK